MTEVLISLGILTFGLLGVLAMFPVGSYYMLRAEIADRGSAVGQAVMNDLVSRGMLDPKAWQMLAVAPTVTPAVDNIDGPANSYTRPVGSAMAEEMTLPAYTSLAPAGRPAYLAQRYGSAYVIDPMALAVATVPPGSPVNPLVSPFPAAAYYYPVGDGTYASTDPWLTWVPPGGPDEQLWPIRRVTYRQPSGARMEAPLAESLFTASDDLSIQLLEGDEPARQTWSMSPSGSAMTRQWVGDYSWIVTIVPTTSEAHQAIATGPGSHAYDVSVVVFYKRALTRSSPTSLTDAYGAAADLLDKERVVRGRIISTGPSGGELLLESLSSSSDPFAPLRAGQWIMLCGPHPNSSPEAPRFVLNWYQVIAIDEDVALFDASLDPATHRVVALRGPEWPWLPASDITDNDLLSNDLCVGIFPGAVAVHTKTMRLEGQRSTAWGTGGSWSSEPASPDPFVLLK